MNPLRTVYTHLTAAMNLYIANRLTFLLIFWVWNSFAANAQPQIRQALPAEIDRLLQSEVENGHIPGAVILVKKGKKILHQQAYGYARKADGERPTAEKTSLQHLYDLASLTKVIGTTTSIMLLVDKGLLKIDDPVGKYVEAFNTPDKKGITIRHLLTHTAGLYEWYPLYYKASNKQESYRLIGELPLRFPVGKQRKYSDLGFVLLGQIIETVSGVSLEQFVTTHIFEPLGMNNTVYNPLKFNKYNKIAATSLGNPYEKRMVYDATLGFQVQDIEPASWNGWRNYILAGEVNDGNTWYANEGVSGAAGLFSTAEDLQKLVDMLKNKGRVGGRSFISAATIQVFLTSDVFNNGLGWMMDPTSAFMKNAPQGSFGHTGFTGTSIVVVPKYNLSVILLINRQNTGLLNSGAYFNLSPLRERIFEAVMKYGGKN